MIQVYYDGKCGLCAREINYYRQRDTQQLIDWVDVTSQLDCLQECDISLATALKHMHARLENGELIRGVHAFIAIWHRIPGWQPLAKFASLPLIKPGLAICYEVFAWLRFRSYRHCRISTQADH
ncbi:MAG: DUF393 domain-containing protein [Gammaproteobacteria bacterium]